MPDAPQPYQRALNGVVKFVVAIVFLVAAAITLPVALRHGTASEAGIAALVLMIATGFWYLRRRR